MQFAVKITMTLKKLSNIVIHFTLFPRQPLANEWKELVKVAPIKWVVSASLLFVYEVIIDIWLLKKFFDFTATSYIQ